MPGLNGIFISMRKRRSKHVNLRKFKIPILIVFGVFILSGLGFLAVSDFYSGSHDAKISIAQWYNKTGAGTSVLACGSSSVNLPTPTSTRTPLPSSTQNSNQGFTPTYTPTPTPTSTHSPTPTQSGSGFIIQTGDNVITNRALNVHTSPSLESQTIALMPMGTLGKIIAGPISADGYTWRQVNYDVDVNGLSGWSVDIGLDKSDANIPFHSIPSTLTTPQFPLSCTIKLGAKVKVQPEVNMNVRSAPNVNSILLGTQAGNTTGMVTDGPVFASGYSWWYVNYGMAPYGWSAGQYLVPVCM